MSSVQDLVRMYKGLSPKEKKKFRVCIDDCDDCLNITDGYIHCKGCDFICPKNLLRDVEEDMYTCEKCKTRFCNDCSQR